MIRRVLAGALLALGLLMALPSSATSSPRCSRSDLDCKESPTPDMPGQGLAAFFQKTPDPLPAAGRPVRQAARRPRSTSSTGSPVCAGTPTTSAAVPTPPATPMRSSARRSATGCSTCPISMTALTVVGHRGGLRADLPQRLRPGHHAVSRRALHESLFASWVPAVIALLGIMILLKARRAALATTAAAIGWALMVVLVATAIFRWPIAAGHFADDTVTSTLGVVVGDLNDGRRTEPRRRRWPPTSRSRSSTTVWLAGTLGSTDSETAKRYGPELFKAQALTWREAEIVAARPGPRQADHRGQEGPLRRDRRRDQARRPDRLRAPDRASGRTPESATPCSPRSGALLALPFLLVAALLLLGSFLIVRLAVMLFPAFATLGVLPRRPRPRPRASDAPSAPR